MEGGGDGQVAPLAAAAASASASKADAPTGPVVNADADADYFVEAGLVPKDRVGQVGQPVPLEEPAKKDRRVEAPTEGELDDANMEACFKAFDRDEDNSLNVNEFSALLKALFRNEKGKPYPIETHLKNDIFGIFNISGDGSLSREEFAYCWNNWIKKIVRPVSALIIVDVQNDFISGTLAISNCPAGQNGEEVVAPINKLIDTVPFDLFCYSLDWHPSDHVSFVDNMTKRTLDKSSALQDYSAINVYDTVVFEGPPKTEQTLWPRHCVQNTWGAELHKDLKVHPQAFTVHKGVNPDIDSYSAFFDNKKLSHTEMEAFLRSHDVTDIYTCGIAYDVCVASTAFHGLDLGFRTAIIDDCSRGIRDEAIEASIEKVKNNNGVVIQSHEVKPMVLGRDRRVEWGYALALNCRKTIVYPLKNKNSRFNKHPSGLPGDPNSAGGGSGSGSGGNKDSSGGNSDGESANQSNHNAVKPEKRNP